MSRKVQTKNKELAQLTMEDLRGGKLNSRGENPVCKALKRHFGIGCLLTQTGARLGEIDYKFAKNTTLFLNRYNRSQKVRAGNLEVDHNNLIISYAPAI